MAKASAGSEAMVPERDYRTFLATELERRKARHKQYSMRAFARDLGWTAPRLSEILSGKRKMGVKAAVRVAQVLKLDQDMTVWFCAQVELDDAASDEARVVARLKLESIIESSKFRVLHDDTFRLIADWYHFAIIEMVDMPGASLNPAWLATRLKITKAEVHDALQRLLRVGFLEEKNGHLQRGESHQVTTSHDIPSDAIMRFHRQVLGLARDALIKYPVEQRDFGSVMMSVDPQQIPEAKQMISRFRRRLMRCLEQGDRRDLYCFSAQLFPIFKN